MAIRESVVNRPKPILVVSDEAVIERLHGHTKKDPMRVSQRMYDEMLKRPGLAAYMFKVAVQPKKEAEAEAAGIVPKALLSGDEIVALTLEGKKIDAIAAVRQKTGMGLAVAKELVEGIERIFR